MLRVGLTGGLASGKSTVARLLALQGAAVRDADRVVHELYAPNAPGSREVAQLFGDSVMADDGSVDTVSLAGVVLADPGKRRRLEEAVHPLVRRELARWLDVMEDADPRPPVALVEAALLVETGSYRAYHRLVVVSADESLRFQRAVLGGWEPERVRSVLAAQLRDDEREAVADYVISNDGSEGDLESSVRKLWGDLLADASLLAKGEPLPGRSRGSA